MGAVPRQRLGVASGLLSMTRTLGQTTGIAIFGAVWATLVALSYGEALPGGATTAPIEAQVVGLKQTFIGIAGVVLIALLLSLWAGRRKNGRKAGKAVDGLLGTGDRQSYPLCFSVNFTLYPQSATITTKHFLFRGIGYGCYCYVLWDYYFDVLF